MCPEIVNPVSLRFDLRDRLENRMILQFIRLSKDFFGVESASKWGSAPLTATLMHYSGRMCVLGNLAVTSEANTVPKDVCHVKVF